MGFGLHHEIEHLKSCPFDVWKIVRISSSSDEEEIRREIRELQENLNDALKFLPYEARTGYQDRKIYLMKVRKPRRYEWNS